jgi:integrase
MGRKPSTERIYTVGPIGVTPDSKGGFRIRWTEDGNKPERTARTKAQAIQIANDEFARISRGESLRGSVTFGKLTADATINRDGRWDDAWNQRINEIARDYILPHIGADTDAKAVSRDDIRAVYQWLSDEGYSKSTFSQTAKVMTMIMREGVRTGVWIFGQQPNVDVKWQSYSASGKQDEQLEPVKPEEIPSDEETAALLQVLRKMELRYYLMAALAATAGLRYSEIMGLKREDFNWQASRIRVERARREHNGRGRVKSPKTAAGKRDVVIDPLILSDLKEFVTRSTQDFVFTTRTGRVIARSNWARVLADARALSGFQDHHALHSLRHYAATRLLDRGVQIKDVSYMLGHANVAITTRLYIHGDPTSLDRIMEAVTAAPPAAIAMIPGQKPKKAAAKKKAAPAKKAAAKKPTIARMDDPLPTRPSSAKAAKADAARRAAGHERPRDTRRREVIDAEVAAGLRDPSTRRRHDAPPPPAKKKAAAKKAAAKKK